MSLMQMVHLKVLTESFYYLASIGIPVIEVYYNWSTKFYICSIATTLFMLLLINKYFRGTLNTKHFIIKQELLCSNKRRVYTFQLHSDIIYYYLLFFKLMNQCINPIRAGLNKPKLFLDGYFSMKKGVWRSKTL